MSRSSLSLPLFMLKMAAVLLMAWLLLVGIGISASRLQSPRAILMFVARDSWLYQLHIYAADLDRRLDEHLLTIDTAGIVVAWSPDGSRLAVAATVTRGVNTDGYDILDTIGIYIVEMETGRQMLLQPPVPLDGLTDQLSWSPNGRQLAYTSEGRLWVVNVDGSDPYELTDTFVRGGAAWSPDGISIAYIRESLQSYTRHLYIAQADGAQNRMLSGDLEDASFSVWSPDGSQLAFVAGDVLDPNLYVVDPSNGSPYLVTENIYSATGSSPAWSPDGQQIVYESSQYPNDLYIVNADGTGERRLTDNEANEMYGFRKPIWTPDGQQIVFIRDGVFLINIDGSNFRQVTQNTQQLFSLNWWRPS